MLHIAAGVALGIVAAVYILNWLSAMAERRAERHRQKQIQRGLYMLYPDQYPYQPSVEQDDPPKGALAAVIIFSLCIVALAWLASLH